MRSNTRTEAKRPTGGGAPAGQKQTPNNQFDKGFLHGETNVKSPLPQADPALPPIGVTEIKPLEDCGALRAFVTVSVGVWKLYGVRIVQQTGQPAWVALPQIRDKRGFFWPCVELFDKDLKAKIEQAVIDKWQSLAEPDSDDEN